MFSSTAARFRDRAIGGTLTTRHAKPSSQALVRQVVEEPPLCLSFPAPEVGAQSVMDEKRPICPVCEMPVRPTEPVGPPTADHRVPHLRCWMRKRQGFCLGASPSPR